ncbi:hypothetical protein F66182_10932 [Fusarium sp. NRRL 66182]|nr:hypothetical protein F66182_10932 [Fusarium sp. NRRL 66182]
MVSSFTLLASGLALAAAQSTTTINFLMPDWDGLTLSASVVGVSGHETTLAVACEGITLDWQMCDTNPKTIVGGPSTLSIAWVDRSAHWAGTETYTKSAAYHCDIFPATATCTSTAISIYRGRTTTSVTTEGYRNPSSWYFHDVTATAGLEKLHPTYSSVPESTSEPATTEAATIPATTSQPESTEPATTAPATTPQPETTEAVETNTKRHANSTVVSGHGVTTHWVKPSEPTVNTTHHAAPAPAPTSPVIIDNASGPSLVQNIGFAGLVAAVGGIAMLL